MQSYVRACTRARAFVLEEKKKIRRRRPTRLIFHTSGSGAVPGGWWRVVVDEGLSRSRSLTGGGGEVRLRTRRVRRSLLRTIQRLLAENGCARILSFEFNARKRSDGEKDELLLVK